MNNKPVAIVRKYVMSGIDNFHVEMLERLTEGTELYTHPADLTDAEIQEISHRYHYTYNPDYIGFARAILRKAQKNG